MTQNEQWHGKLPKAWRSAPLGALVHSLGGATPSSSNEAFWCDPDDGVPWVAIGDMSGLDSVTETKKGLTPIGLAERGITPGKPGTLLFAMYASVGEVARLDISATWNQAILGLTPKKDLVVPRFIHYVLKSIRPNLALHFRSNTQNNLNAWQVRHLKTPLPPSFTVQEDIADFLDHETGQINVMIKAQEELRRFVTERRSAVIHQYVTRGLSAEVQLRPSGIEWLGNVPKHWLVENIRRHADMKTGHTPSRAVPEYWENCDTPWITLADVWQLRSGRIEYIESSDEMISRLGIQNSAAELLPAGTVVLSRTASVGFSGIMKTPMATSQDYWNWVCRATLMPEYLLYVFRAMEQEFQALSRGSTHQTIYKPIAAGLVIPVPPKEEQEQIVAALRATLQRTDQLLDEVAMTTALLRERREALISAAVTGKIDPETGVERIYPASRKEVS